ncbi:hypothetical protein GCM10010261_60040 [Streptomyces pilosus]|nr:hypothetical protein GCM10010261_60040 [Streptomyces pilosus]
MLAEVHQAGINRREEHRQHDHPHWALFDCGRTEFLRRLITAEFDVRPPSDLSPWGRVGTCVHHEEQGRRFSAGLCAMTGKPNPNTGMFD